MITIGMYWINLQKNVAAVRRVFFFLDYDTEDQVAGDVFPAFGQTASFVHVDYRYPGGDHVLKDINLRLETGKLNAIVGPTGAGKTTLAYLLPGFLRPTGGRVLFDDQDIRTADVNWLRDQVTYVFQEHTLLSDSIRENIRWANPSATDADIMSALETAGAMEFVSKLPDGIDTMLGRSGNTLSVGQQQRLSIARGLVRDTRILILDEPTAALDPKTEMALVHALKQATRDRLVIVIAHRLSTIRTAHRIVFLEDGEIKDVGNHETLMADPEGSYRKFVDLQHGAWTLNARDRTSWKR